MGIHAIELFSGVGMLGEGLRAGLAHLGVAYRTLCHVEREAHPCGVLAARMEEGSLDPAPVWSDVCTFDARAWHGRVDCVVAGFPCQDLSVAGRRAGLDGKRSGLFFEVVRIATDSGAWLMLLENVAGIASATATVVDEAEGELDERAASRVVGELADLGWDAEWITLSASDVGASHGRARWFCLAWRTVANAHHDGREGRRLSATGGRLGQVDLVGSGDAVEQSARIGREKRRAESAGQQGRSDAAFDGGSVADPRRWDVRRLEPIAVSGCGDQTGDHAGGRFMADTSSARLEGRELGRARDGRGGGRKHMDQLANFVAYSPLAQPTRDGQESSPNTPNSPRHLNPLFGAWLMGWPSTWVIAEPHASGASATASWRRALQRQLSCSLGEPGCSHLDQP